MLRHSILFLALSASTAAEAQAPDQARRDRVRAELHRLSPDTRREVEAVLDRQDGGTRPARTPAAASGQASACPGGYWLVKPSRTDKGFFMCPMRPPRNLAERQGEATAVQAVVPGTRP